MKKLLIVLPLLIVLAACALYVPPVRLGTQATPNYFVPQSAPTETLVPQLAFSADGQTVVFPTPASFEGHYDDPAWNTQGLTLIPSGGSKYIEFLGGQNVTVVNNSGISVYYDFGKLNAVVGGYASCPSKITIVYMDPQLFYETKTNGVSDGYYVTSAGGKRTAAGMLAACWATSNPQADRQQLAAKALDLVENEYAGQAIIDLDRPTVP